MSEAELQALGMLRHPEQLNSWSFSAGLQPWRSHVPKSKSNISSKMQLFGESHFVFGSVSILHQLSAVLLGISKDPHRAYSPDQGAPGAYRRGRPCARQVAAAIQGKPGGREPSLFWDRGSSCLSTRYDDYEFGCSMRVPVCFAYMYLRIYTYMGLCTYPYTLHGHHVCMYRYRYVYMYICTCLYTYIIKKWYMRLQCHFYRTSTTGHPTVTDEKYTDPATFASDVKWRLAGVQDTSELQAETAPAMRCRGFLHEEP